MATEPTAPPATGRAADIAAVEGCKRRVVLGILGAAGIVAAFVVLSNLFDGGGGSLPNRTITAAEFGDRWPFTVAAGELYCTGASVVTFVAAGDTYAVNGAATQAGRGKDIGPIWAADTSSGGTKKSIAPIIDAGLALCR